LREIVLDTETTGLDHLEDRIIELGGVELVNRFPTGRSFHFFINPQGRKIHAEALAIHGIGEAQLADKPVFAGILDQFIEFIDDAKLIAHNAGFDVAFLNAEFQRLGQPGLEPHRIIDTLAIARRKHPMGPNSLDALCRRYGIDNSHRTKHGALLDSELLAEVYVELAGGRQASLILEASPAASSRRASSDIVIGVLKRPEPLRPRLSAEELAAHRGLIQGLGEKAIWGAIEPSAVTVAMR